MPRSVAAQSRTEGLQRLSGWAQRRHEETAQDLGLEALRRSSYYRAAKQVFTFELERRRAGGRPEALATWSARTTMGLEDLREEMRREASPQRELPPAVSA